MIDPESVVRMFLQGQMSLTSITHADADKGIYRTPPGLPFKVEANDKPPKCVVIQGLPGPSSSWPNISPRFYIKAYGRTGPAAREVYQRVWDAFYPGGVTRCPVLVNNRFLMRTANLDTGLSGLEPQGWPFVLGTLEAHFDPNLGEL